MKYIYIFFKKKIYIYIYIYKFYFFLKDKINFTVIMLQSAKISFFLSFSMLRNFAARTNPMKFRNFCENSQGLRNLAGVEKFSGLFLNLLLLWKLSTNLQK